METAHARGYITIDEEAFARLIVPGISTINAEKSGPWLASSLENSVDYDFGGHLRSPQRFRVADEIQTVGLCPLDRTVMREFCSSCLLVRVFGGIVNRSDLLVLDDLITGFRIPKRWSGVVDSRGYRFSKRYETLIVEKLSCIPSFGSARFAVYVAASFARDDAFELSDRRDICSIVGVEDESECLFIVKGASIHWSSADWK
ncbi:hypothetical protein KM043_002092 [Ampulex compressa]|nr:hypothetical protein KM043_002092 [Ampulex compressa]